MMNEDPPDHSRMRGVMQPSFSGHSVNDLSARVREITEELLRPFERGVPFDAIRELAGVSIPRGGRVYAHLASANRDPAQFPEPDVFDVTRRNANTNLSFGRGQHICLGASLARLEARIALDVLLAKAPDYRILEGEDDLAWKPPANFRSLERLTLVAN